MSIYIPNMRPPEACEDCPLYSKNSSKCLAVNPPRFFDPHALAWREPEPGGELGDKPSWCPLVEVPPHGRLFDEEQILRLINEQRQDEYNKTHSPKMMWSDVMNAFEWLLQWADTIIPAEGGAGNG